MKLLQIRLEENFLIPINKERRKRILSLNFKKLIKKLKNLSKNLKKVRRRKRKKWNRQLQWRLIREILYKINS